MSVDNGDKRTYIPLVTGKQLSRWIESRGWNQTRAAAELGVTRAAVSRWVNGDRRVPETVARLVALMGASK